MSSVRSGQLQPLVDALGAPFLVLELSAFAEAVSLRLSRLLGYVDAEPAVRRMAIEYCRPDTGRPVALLDQELVLPAPAEGWAVTLGGGGLLGADAEWDLWDDAGSHVKTFARGELPLVFVKETPDVRVALAVDPEAVEVLDLELGEHLLRPLLPEDRQVLRR